MKWLTRFSPSPLLFWRIDPYRQCLFLPPIQQLQSDRRLRAWENVIFHLSFTVSMLISRNCQFLDWKAPSPHAEMTWTSSFVRGCLQHTVGRWRRNRVFLPAASGCRIGGSPLCARSNGVHDLVSWGTPFIEAPAPSATARATRSGCMAVNSTTLVALRPFHNPLQASKPSVSGIRISSSTTSGGA